LKPKRPTSQEIRENLSGGGVQREKLSRKGHRVRVKEAKDAAPKKSLSLDRREEGKKKKKEQSRHAKRVL